jgi:hypothetical protein
MRNSGEKKSEIEFCSIFGDTLRINDRWVSYIDSVNLNAKVFNHVTGELVDKRITLNYFQDDALDKFNRTLKPNKDSKAEVNNIEKKNRCQPLCKENV